MHEAVLTVTCKMKFLTQLGGVACKVSRKLLVQASSGSLAMLDSRHGRASSVDVPLAFLSERSSSQYCVSVHELF